MTDHARTDAPMSRAIQREIRNCERFATTEWTP